MAVIRKSALAVVKGSKLLVVRKGGTRLLLMPGGKLEGSETEIEALHREIKEELGCGIDGASIVFLGTFEDIAADRAAAVSIGLYSGRLTGKPAACSEIEELVWVAASGHPQLSPVIRNRILPFLVESRLLS